MVVHTGSKKKAIKRSGFVYKARSTEDVKKRAERSGGRYDSPYKPGIDTFRAKVGDNVIRILPPTWEDADHYAYTIYVHSYIGADNSTYLCPSKMLGKKCAICTAAKAAKEAGETDEAKALQWKELSVAWVLNRDEDETTPIIYPMSWTMDRDIAALTHFKKTGKVLLIDHPDKGYDVTIKRQGQGLKTRYFGMAIDRDPSPISDDEDVQEEVLNYIQENPIPSILHYYDNAYLTKVLAGTAEEKDEDLDEDEEDTSDDHDHEEEEAKASKRHAKSKRHADEDEDEEEEKPKRKGKAAVAEDDDEDEEEKPRGKAKKKAKARDEDEEDDEEVVPDDEEETSEDDDADDEDEEEERPKAKVKAKTNGRKARAEPEDDDEDEEEEVTRPARRKPVERQRLSRR